MPQRKVDMVNHPTHYTNSNKKLEIIDKIEDAVQFAPDPVLGGLQWQVLKVHGSGSGRKGILSKTLKKHSGISKD
jgi:hypothetical protein